VIIAIHLKTESGDGYLFLEEVSNEAEMLEGIEQALGDELGYVSEYDIEVIDGDPSVMRHLLSNAIDYAQDDEGY